MHAHKITEKDDVIWQLLKDPRYRVDTNTGEIFTQCRIGGTGLGPWRRAGWLSPSREGTKVYRRLQYRGEELYEHRIVWAAKHGFLCPYRTINHKNLNGLDNRPPNLELISPGENVSHAVQAYKRMGMSAAEAKAGWIKGAGLDRRWRGTKWTRYSSL